MTVGKILEIALRRLDEDDDAFVCDLGMYEGQFKVYLTGAAGTCAFCACGLYLLSAPVQWQSE